MKTKMPAQPSAAAAPQDQGLWDRRSFLKGLGCSVGLTLADEKDPIEALRVVHSFDPCVQCAVH